MSNSKKCYLLIVPPTLDPEELSNNIEDLQEMFQIYRAVKSTEGIDPIIKVSEIPQDLFEVLKNNILVEYGILYAARNIIYFERVNSQVILVTFGDLQKYVLQYQTNLRKTQQGLLKNLNLITQQLLDLTEFTRKTIEPFCGKNEAHKNK